MGCWRFCFVLTMMIFATATRVDGYGRELSKRRLQRQEELKVKQYDQCSLCKGLDILENEIPPYVGKIWEDELPELINVTCAIMNEEYMRTQSGYLGPTCRSDGLFNIYFDTCCSASLPLYECEQNVQNAIPSESYNPLVPPIAGKKPNQGLEVEILFTYEALEDIDVEKGTATVNMALDFWWTDPRLIWDVDEEKCANMINLWTGHEESEREIWIPDFDLFNQIEGIQSFPKTSATVYSDGTVHWRVSGGMKAFCSYTGLGTIPFDTLGCQLAFEPRTRYYSNLITYKISEPEYVLYGPFNDAYSEFSVIPERGEIGTFNDGIGIYYNVYFQRASNQYVVNIVLPTMVLTFLSFFSFLLDVRVGERLGFGLTIALVVVAQQILTSEMLPVSTRPLWMHYFTFISFYFVIVAIIQSVIVGYLYYLREDRREKRGESYSEIGKENEKKVEEFQEMYAAKDDEQEETPSTLGMAPITSFLVSARTLRGERKKYPAFTNDGIQVDDNASNKKSCKDYLFYKCPLRRLDTIVGVVVVVLYIIFVIFMLVTRNNEKMWLNGEPKWFNESSSIADYNSFYINGDPEN